MVMMSQAVPRTDPGAVIDYFRTRADGYDLVEAQAYWRLSDLLLRELLDELLPGSLPAAFEFLDAGGGTGRWSEWLLMRHGQARGVLYDLSPDMIRVASARASDRRFGDRLEIVTAV